jgi:hypothetical protein
MIENTNTKRIPTLDDCLRDDAIVPEWEELSETIYQHEKKLFQLKQIAAGYYWKKYRWETPDPRKRMEAEGIKVNQTVCRGKVLPEKAFC